MRLKGRKAIAYPERTCPSIFSIALALEGLFDKAATQRTFKNQIQKVNFLKVTSSKPSVSIVKY